MGGPEATLLLVLLLLLPPLLVVVVVLLLLLHAEAMHMIATTPTTLKSFERADTVI